MITRIVAKNFGIFKELDLVLEEGKKYFVNAINHDIPGADSNQSGKTTLLNIPCFANFGKLPGTDQFKKFKKEDIVSTGETEGFVEVTEKIKGVNDLIKIRRGVGNNKELKYWVGNILTEKGTATLTQDALYKTLQYPIKQRLTAFSDFQRTTRIEGKKVDEFATGSPTDNAKFIGRLFAQEVWDILLDTIKKDFNENVNPNLIIFESKLKGIATLEELEKEIKEIQTTRTKLEDEISIATKEKETLLQEQGRLTTVEDQRQTLESLKIQLRSFRVGKETEIDRMKNTIIENQDKIKETQAFVDKNPNTETVDIIEERKKKLETEIIEIEETLIKHQHETTEPLQEKKINLENKLLTNKYFPINMINIKKDRLASDEGMARYEQLLIGEKEQILKHRSGASLICPSCETTLSFLNTKLRIFDEDSEIEIIGKTLKELFNIYGALDTATGYRLSLKEKVKPIRDQIEELTETKMVILKVTDLKKQIEELQTTVLKDDKDIRQVITEARTQISDLEKQIEEQTQKVAKLADIEKVRQIAEDIKSKTLIIGGNQRRISTKDKESGELVAKFEETKTTISRLEEFYERKKEIDHYLAWIPRIKNRIVESKIPILEELTNEALAQINAKAFLRLKMSKENAKGMEIVTFNPVLVREGEETPLYRESSGGIRRVGIAIISSALQMGVGAKFEFFSLDEAFDTLDRTGRSTVAELINNIPYQGLITTHTDDIQNHFEKQILIERRNNIATARIL